MHIIKCIIKYRPGAMAGALLESCRQSIVAFATHGLIPGDFPNLDEPALALSASDGKAETGLLTLGDILALKLDALRALCRGSCPLACGSAQAGEPGGDGR